MSAVQQYILAIDHDPEDAQRIAQITSTENKSTTLIQIVESLAEYINDENDAIRSKAVRYLIQVFEALPAKFLSRQQIQVLCQFLCDRIQDEGALHGLSVLASLSRCTAEMAVMIFRAVHVQFEDLQASAQSKRFEVLSLVNILMTQHRASIRTLGTESLQGLVDLFAGERDPRNLMLVFSMFRIVIAEWDLGEHVENVYDSVFCYFPITFRPPPNDPYGITAQDLKSRLQDCLSASQAFAPFAFPQLLLKLDANSINAKRDVLHTLDACAASYGPQIVHTYASTIWEALKFEVFNAQEDEMSELALIALKSVARTLQYANGSPNPMSTFLKPIAVDCNERLQEPQQKQARPAACIVGALGSTSYEALHTLANDCIPPLVRLYQDALNFEIRRAILDIFADILRGAVEVETSSSASSSPLQESKDDLFMMFSRALMSSNADEIAFRLSALRCLALCAKCPRLLEASEVGMIIQHLDEIILNTSVGTAPTLKDEAIASLSELSERAPKLVSDVAIPALLAKLPDSVDCSNSVYDVLNSISRFSFERSLTSTLSRRLLNKAKLIGQSSTTSQYLQALLATLYVLLGKHDLSLDANLEAYFDIVQDIIGMMTEQSAASGAQDLKPAIARMLGRVTAQIFGSMSKHAQENALGKFFPIFKQLGQDVKDGTGKLPEYNSLILSTYALAALKKETALPFSQEQLHHRLKQLVTVAQGSLDSVSRLCAVQQSALIVNKFFDSNEFPKVEEILWETNEGLFTADSTKRASIRAGFWVLKGLIVRLSHINDLLERMFNALSDDNHGLDMALGFELLLSPDEILAKENGARIGRLAPQKIFNLCLTQVKTRIQGVPVDVKTNYLIALSGLLRYMKEEIVIPRADELLPLLLQALDLSKSSAREAALQTLTTLLKSSPDSVKSHAPSLINRLLNAAQDYQRDTENIRYRALECLEIFPSRIPSSTLIPYRRAALKGLLRMLDDPRRHVRKKAVECRTAWLNLDEPEEDD